MPPDIVRIAKFVALERDEALGDLLARLVREPLLAEHRRIFGQQAAIARGLSGGPPPGPATTAAEPVAASEPLEEPDRDEDDDDEDLDDDLLRDELDTDDEPTVVPAANTAAKPVPVPKLTREQIAARKPELIAKAKALRKEGLAFKPIGDRLGVSASTAQNFIRGR